MLYCTYPLLPAGDELIVQDLSAERSYDTPFIVNVRLVGTFKAKAEPRADIARASVKYKFVPSDISVVESDTIPVCQFTESTASVGVDIFVICESVVGLSVVTMYDADFPVPSSATVNQSPLCDACTHAFARAVVVFEKFPRYSEIAKAPN